MRFGGLVSWRPWCRRLTLPRAWNVCTHRHAERRRRPACAATPLIQKCAWATSNRSSRHCAVRARGRTPACTGAGRPWAPRPAARRRRARRGSRRGVTRRGRSGESRRVKTRDVVPRRGPGPPTTRPRGRSGRRRRPAPITASGLACSDTMAILIAPPPSAAGPSRRESAASPYRARAAARPAAPAAAAASRVVHQLAHGAVQLVHRVETRPAPGGTASYASVVPSATTGMPRCIASISDRPSEVHRNGWR